jgi:hypothetical protein
MKYTFTLYLGLLKGRPSYRRSLQTSKFFSLFILLWVIFDLLDPDPDPVVHLDPQHCWFKMTVSERESGSRRAKMTLRNRKS